MHIVLKEVKIPRQSISGKILSHSISKGKY